ncbi:LysR family transcriptional regulator [Ideonella sp. YS5]|uniref:LysR family transcriptional regulator n=1 Tax=Ideonella sp. YS5 TaxID=3453714 RepID=UPI003EEF3951
MDKLKSLQTFIRIAELGSLTAAAGALGMSLPSVVRQLAALEAHLGTRLFQRTTRRVSLTAEGRAYLARCRDALGLLAEADAELQAEGGECRGHLTVTAPVLFGQMHVAALLARFTMSHPQVTAELLLLDRYVNLVEEGVDVGVRIGELADSSLVAVPLGEVRPLIVASPAWLERHGTPREPAALRGFECISYSGEREADWLLAHGGRRLRVPVQGRLRFNHPGAALRACEEGAGIGLFLSYQVREAVAAGRLRPVLRSFQPPPQPVQLVLPHARLLPARTRAFVEAAKVELAAALKP